MDVIFVVISIVLSVMLAGAAAADLVRHRKIAVNMAQVGVPESWMMMLGVLKAAGAAGLLVGILVPPIGVAAATGVVLYFVGAIVVHVRAHAYAASGGFPLAIMFLVLAAIVLALRTATA